MCGCVVDGDNGDGNNIARVHVAVFAHCSVSVWVVVAHANCSVYEVVAVPNQYGCVLAVCVVETVDVAVGIVHIIVCCDVVDVISMLTRTRMWVMSASML